jgi:AraC family transcriptional regulator
MSRIAEASFEGAIATSCEGTIAKREQITGIVGGQIVSVSDAPLMTSASTPWPGFLLERHAAQVVRQDVRWGWHRTHVCLLTSGSINFRVYRHGVEEDFLGRSGSVFVFPSGFDETRFFFANSDFRLICLELDPIRVAKLLGRKGPASDGALLPQIGVEDAHIAALLRSMAAEVAEGCPAGKLYGQSLSLTLAAYLEGRFSANKVERKRVERRFSHPQVQRLVDYIRANLGKDLNLIQLANLVEMSPRQFFRLFANTFECTPHRYVMKERVARGKELLSAGLSLVEIAHTLGFASQSHFSDVFRKTTGASPGRFRQETGSGLLMCRQPQGHGSYLDSVPLPQPDSVELGDSSDILGDLEKQNS